MLSVVGMSGCGERFERRENGFVLDELHCTDKDGVE